MGAKYTTNSTFSGYNSSPPSDDGAQTAANLITWAKHKTKLADPVKTEVSNIDSDLLTAFNYTPRRITTSDTLVADDHMRTVEIAPTATTSVVITLPDAGTLGTLFRCYLKNSSSHTQLISRATSGDTIDGTAADIYIPSKAAFCITTNNNASSVADGYLITGFHSFKSRTIQNFTSAGSGTYTTPNGVKWIRVRMVGGGGGGGGGGTSGGAGGAGGNSTFDTMTASGGAAGANAGTATVGGAASNGDINIPGGSGQGGSTATNSLGGQGGCSAFGGNGGGGSAGAAGAPQNATTNSGSGGGGGGTGANAGAGSGGAAGGYCEKVFDSPSATYSYAVGAAGSAGSAGTGGAGGGTGAAGRIIVEEYYK